MRSRHRIRVNITNPGGRREAVLRGGSGRVRRRLLDFLLGEKTDVFVISPGSSVRTVEIHETAGESEDEARADPKQSAG